MSDGILWASRDVTGQQRLSKQTPARLEPGVRPARAPHGPAKDPCLVGKSKGRHRRLVLVELSTVALPFFTEKARQEEGKPDPR